MATLKYFAQKTKDGYPIPSTMMGFKQAPKAETLVEIEAKNYTAAAGQSVAKPDSGLRYFVRRKPNGDIIPNSLITSLKKPAGPVYEFKVITGTATPVSAGFPIKISYQQMGDGVVCNLTETNFSVEITAGTSLSNATQITGNFASLGAYYTPKDPNDGMAQDPRFWIAYQVGNVWKNRQFKLTAVGVADGSDAMFGTTQEAICQTYWIADRYNVQLGCTETIETDLTVAVPSGATLEIGKFYKPVGDTTNTYVIKSRTLAAMASASIDATAVFNTCTASFA